MRIRRSSGRATKSRGCVQALVLIIAAAMNRAAADELRLEALEATRARPLFAPTRRPPPAPAPLPKPVAIETPPPVEVLPTPPDLRLVGVILGSATQKAIVRRGPDLKSISLAMGDEIDGWQVTRIEPRQVILSRAEQSATIAFGPQAR